MLVLLASVWATFTGLLYIFYVNNENTKLKPNDLENNEVYTNPLDNQLNRVEDGSGYSENEPFVKSSEDLNLNDDLWTSEKPVEVVIPENLFDINDLIKESHAEIKQERPDFPEELFDQGVEMMEENVIQNKRQALLKKLAYQEEIANLIVPEFNIEAIESIPEFSSNRNRDKKDDDQKPPGGGTTAINPETSQQGSNISGPEWTPEERLEFEKLEGLLDEMGENIKTQQRINTNQTVQPANQYYQAVENLDHGNAFEYLKNLVEDEQSGVKKLELNKKVSLLSVQIEQLLSLELTDDDKNGVEALKTMLMKELNERNFSKQEISDFFQPIINRIWEKISRYNINIPAQFQPKNSTEQNPELVNLNHELADLVEDAKISGLSSELVKTYTKLGNIGLTPELLKAQIKNLKLDIITHTLKSIEQNKPFTISIETQKLITNPDLVKTAIERNPEFLVPEFFQNFIAASQKRLKNTQALEFEKQVIIFLLDFIFKTYYAFETVFMNQPVFESTEAVLNAIQSAEKEVIYTDGKNSFVISSFEIRNRIWLKMKLKNSNGFQFFKFQINEIGKVYPLKNFTFA